MTFDIIKKQLIYYLQSVDNTLDYENDFCLLNKIEELAYMICRRQENPYIKLDKYVDNQEFKKEFGR
jgi:hypothetical protein